jgi:hypothetical protein
MALEQQPPETDLWLPLPSEGQQLDPRAVHTHYFGFSVPGRVSHSNCQEAWFAAHQRLIARNARQLQGART